MLKYPSFRSKKGAAILCAHAVYVVCVRARAVCFTEKGRPTAEAGLFAGPSPVLCACVCADRLQKEGTVEYCPCEVHPLHGRETRIAKTNTTFQMGVGGLKGGCRAREEGHTQYAKRLVVRELF